jgi:hypothetical protein
MEIDTTDKAIEEVYEGYRGLLEKFPRSVNLLKSFSSFCDVVMNRSHEAAQLNEQAEAILAGDDESEAMNSNAGKIAHSEIYLSVRLHTRIKMPSSNRCTNGGCLFDRGDDGKLPELVLADDVVPSSLQMAGKITRSTVMATSGVEWRQRRPSR